MINWLLLRRVTSEGRYIPAVDGLRFMAIGMVVLGHILVYTTDKSGVVLNDNSFAGFLIHSFTNAGLGVHLFFTLSGFILALPFAEYYIAAGKKVNLRQYYLRRFTRLEPPYIIALLIAFFLLTYVQRSFSAASLLPHLMASLTYTHYVFWPYETPTVLPIAWSLEAEIQFYLLAPLLARIFNLSPLIRRVILLAAIAGLPLLIHTQNWMYPIKLAQHIQFFLAGYLLADWYITAPRKDSSLVSKLMGYTSLVILLWVTPHYLDLTFHNQWITPLLILPVFYCILCRKWLASFFEQRIVIILGGMCYTIYLFHYMIISGIGRNTVAWTRNFSAPVHYLLQCGILLPFILAWCVPFYYYIERVCMQKEWYRKIFSAERKQLLQ